CDRWIFRGLYATGSEAGFVWDMTTADRAEFSAVVEDCVGIGRFAGAGVIAHVSRKGEPVVFRRSYFMNPDTWGDAGGAYVLAGYTVFGTGRPQYNNHVAGEGKDPPPTFTLKGTNRAYVQFEQELPKGFERLGLWPTEAMSAIAPPKTRTGK